MKFVLDYKPSIYMVFIFIIIAAALMQPGLHMIVALPFLIAFGFAIRWVAKIEERHR